MRSSESLNDRLARLEKQVRQARLGGVLALLLLGAVMCTGAIARNPSPPDIIRARRVDIVDDGGKGVVRLLAGQDGGEIQVLDKAGQHSVSLLVTASGGRVTVFDERGRTALASGNDSNGGATTVFNRAGSRSGSLHVSDSGDGLISVTSASGDQTQDMTPRGVKAPPSGGVEKD